jgi:dolichyl-phosphate-mannose-protein mannosyltransferase
VPVGEFLAGIGLLGLTVGSASLFAAMIVSRRLGALRGAPRILAFGLFAVVGFLAIHLVPGVLGVLGKGSVAVSSLVLVAGATRIRPRTGAADPQPPYPPGPPSGRLSWGLALTAVALYLVYLLALDADHGGEAAIGVDMTTFHLPNIARWIQTGSLWQIPDFVPNGAFGAYPNTSDAMTLGAVLPFRNEFLVHFVNYPALAMTGIAVYALARELAAPAAPAVLFATGFLAMPILTETAYEGLSDTLMFATFSTGLLFLMRRHRTGAGSDLLIGGVALGISLGTKWYAAPAVVLAILGWSALTLLTRGDRRETLRGAGIVTALVVAFGGFWLLRNLILLGDPVFPAKVSVGRITLFHAPGDIRREVSGFTLAGYIDDPGVWRHVLWPTFLEHLSWFAVLLWAVFPVAVVLAWLRLRRPGGEREPVDRVLACIAMAAVISLVYLVTPYTALGTAGNPVLAVANSRYVMPALAIAAALGAWASGRFGRLRPLAEVLALVALLDALRRETDVSAKALSAAALAVAGIAAAVWLTSRARRRLQRSWRAQHVAVGVACAAAVLVGGLYLQERRFNDHRYTEGEATGRWVSLNAPSGHQIGVAGEGFGGIYQMFGPRLRNEVEYVGPRMERMLRPYRRRLDFEAAIARGNYDLVLLHDAGLTEPGLPRRQERWLRALGYRLIAASWRVRLYRALKAGQ